MISSEVYARRRAGFLDELRRRGSCVALLPSAPVSNRSNDVDYEFRQDSDFHYLTGFDEPGSFALFAPDHPEHEFVLFVRPRDSEREVWDGYRSGIEGAIRDHAAGMAFEASALESVFSRYAERRSILVAPIGRSASFDSLLTGIVARFRQQGRLGIPGPATLTDLAPILHEMRVRKSEEELAELRLAAEIGSAAHVRAMEIARPGMWEHEIESEIEHVFRKRGAFGPSYPSIVGSGANSCVLHYNSNGRRIEAGDMVLVDAGCEVEFYASDITRTWPIDGRFSREQREVYEICLDAQKAAISVVQPGRRFVEPHEAALQVLVEGMIRIGLLKDSPESAIEKESYKPFSMHRTSHWLGLDVHDVGDYKHGEEWRPLEPGMVITVEPGIYVRESPEVEPRWWNIGVRIEDDIVITGTGGSILTDGAPKEVSQIESLVGRACR